MTIYPSHTVYDFIVLWIKLLHSYCKYKSTQHNAESVGWRWKQNFQCFCGDLRISRLDFNPEHWKVWRLKYTFKVNIICDLKHLIFFQQRQDQFICFVHKWARISSFQVRRYFVLSKQSSNSLLRQPTMEQLGEWRPRLSCFQNPS